MGGACCSSSAAGTNVYSADGKAFGDTPKLSVTPHVTFGVFSKGGKGESQNQDSPMTIAKMNGNVNAHLFGVFDGHGGGGGEVSKYLRSQFPVILGGDSAWPRKPQIALKNAAAAVNEKLKSSGMEATHSGSTGCICALVGDQIYTANTGDSRAILGIRNGSKGARPMQITEDQTAKNSKDRARIIAAGGRIMGERIYCANSDEPGLIPSRAYGDFSGTPAGVICDPDIQCHEITDDTAWMCIMSDGVWENVPGASISSIIMSSSSLSSAARDIVEEAKRIIHSGKRYRDDMTAVVIQFHNYGPQAAARSRRISDNNEVLQDEEITEDEMLVECLTVCREAMEQGVHVEDVLDMLVGLSDEVRAKVQTQLKKETDRKNESHGGGSSNTDPKKKSKLSRRSSETEGQRGVEKSTKKQFRRRTMVAS